MRSQVLPRQIENQNSFLQACGEETRAAILEGGVLHAFDGGAVLFRDGGPAGVVLFPLVGALQMGKSATRGRRQVLCTVNPQSCGGICLLMMADRGLADVRALEPGQVAALPRAEFQALARKDPLLCQSAWGAAAECMAHLGGLVEHLSFRKVGQRVALALLENTTQDGDMVRLTQAGLAAEVGTTREVVARCLAGLQKAGAIRLGRGRITVMHRNQVAKETLD